MLRVLVLIVALVGLPACACFASQASNVLVIASWTVLGIGCTVAIVAAIYGKKDERPHWRRPIAGERPSTVIYRELCPILWMYNILWMVAVALVTLAVCLALMAWQLWPGEIISVARMPMKAGQLFAGIAALCVTGSFVVRMWLMEVLREQGHLLSIELRASRHVEDAKRQQGEYNPWLADNQGDWPKT